MLYLILYGLLMISRWIYNNPDPIGYDGNGNYLPHKKFLQDQCDKCHNPSVVEARLSEYSKSRHFRGRSFRRARTGECAPCHTHEGFLDVIKNNTSAEFKADPKNPSAFINCFVASDSSLVYPGPIICFTCHSSVHTRHTPDEFYPLTSTRPVPMTMWGGSKTISFRRDISNLCAKCHQPRPVISPSGKPIDYSGLTGEKSSVFNAATFSYDTGIHFGTQAAIFSGIGAVEFGSGYSNSAHTEKASCTDCHMSEPSNSGGGHTFIAKGNFNGCNKAGCHSSRNESDPELKKVLNEINSGILKLGEKLDRISEPGILKKDTATGVFTGYPDIYDPQFNPNGKYRSPSTAGWNEGDINHNSSLPPFPQLSNAQFGAFLNFQMVLRDGSKGIHNYNYTRRLIKKSISAF